MAVIHSVFCLQLCILIVVACYLSMCVQVLLTDDFIDEMLKDVASVSDIEVVGIPSIYGVFCKVFHCSHSPVTAGEQCSTWIELE